MAARRSLAYGTFATGRGDAIRCGCGHHDCLPSVAAAKLLRKNIRSSWLGVSVTVTIGSMPASLPDAAVRDRGHYRTE